LRFATPPPRFACAAAEPALAEASSVAPMRRGRGTGEATGARSHPIAQSKRPSGVRSDAALHESATLITQSSKNYIASIYRENAANSFDRLGKMPVQSISCDGKRMSSEKTTSKIVFYKKKSNSFPAPPNPPVILKIARDSLVTPSPSQPHSRKARHIALTSLQRVSSATGFAWTFARGRSPKSSRSQPPRKEKREGSALFYLNPRETSVSLSFAYPPGSTPIRSSTSRSPLEDRCGPRRRLPKRRAVGCVVCAGRPVDRRRRPRRRDHLGRRACCRGALPPPRLAVRCDCPARAKRRARGVWGR